MGYFCFLKIWDRSLFKSASTSVSVTSKWHEHLRTQGHKPHPEVFAAAVRDGALGAGSVSPRPAVVSTQGAYKPIYWGYVGDLMGIMEKNMENIGVTGPVAAHTPAGEGQRQQ